jgi:hypothetical protein
LGFAWSRESWRLLTEDPTKEKEHLARFLSTKCISVREGIRLAPLLMRRLAGESFPLVMGVLLTQVRSKGNLKQ